jgi:hypothetical protein
MDSPGSSNLIYKLGTLVGLSSEKTTAARHCAPKQKQQDSEKDAIDRRWTASSQNAEQLAFFLCRNARARVLCFSGVSRPPVSFSRPPDPQPEPARPAGFLRVMGAVLWSFFGIRRRASGERDAVTIKPVHVIIAGVLGAAIFVAILVTLVHFITRAH